MGRPEALMASVTEATVQLFSRYSDLLYTQRDIIEEFGRVEEPSRLSLHNLIWMCQEGQIGLLTGSMPIDKASRWLGFVQGCLTMRGLIDVDEERTFSRPLFHAAYAAEGISIPETRENG